MFACSWTTHANQYASSYACGVSTTYSTLAAAKAKCLEYGPQECKAVTCNSAGDSCTLRATATLTASSSSETTYTVDCGTSCSWSGANKNQYLGDYANHDDKAHTNDAAGIAAAKAKCEEYGPVVCSGITCSDSGCSVRGKFFMNYFSGNNDMTYQMSCGNYPF